MEPLQLVHQGLISWLHSIVRHLDVGDIVTQYRQTVDGKEMEKYRSMHCITALS